MRVRGRSTRSLTIMGMVAASAVGAFVVVATAQEIVARAPFWPAIVGQPVVTEWYSDIPWHQKLGTYAGNEIDEALVLPYDALGEKEKAFCTSQKLTQEDCMVELGVNNVLGIRRIDTPYDPSDPKIKAAQECQGAGLPCIEVMLELSSFWSRTKGLGVEMQPRPFGPGNAEPPGSEQYHGYVISDGSTYAPQMPWYMSHYCDSLFAATADVQDPACYGDYLSPMNNGFNPLPATPVDGWPRSMPWSVYPSAPAPNPTNHCKGGNGETKCSMVMAGFDLTPVPSNLADVKYQKYNANLFTWFNNSLKSFASGFSEADRQRHFPWNGTEYSWETFYYPRAMLDPFLGQFENVKTADAVGPNCDVDLSGPTVAPPCAQTEQRRASRMLYPRQCALTDLYKAAGGAGETVEKLRKCGLNYELHHNGFFDQWPESFWEDIKKAGMIANQYGRTSFLFAGVPGMQMPVSFYKDPTSDSGLTVYQQSHNASIFSLYLPIANVADTKRALTGRNYSDTEFFHTLLMSNHMEADPPQFAEGIRGKVLWHNEYRTQKMYDAFAQGNQKFGTRMFAAAFDAKTAPSPFHNNTCDSCHVRNGSGIPTNTAGKLDPTLQEFMKGDPYNPYSPVKDYTFTGEIRPMKLVFFDLTRDTTRLDSSRYSEPLAFPPALLAHPPRTVQVEDLYYNNKIMNFYGDSFHVTTAGYNYAWNYEPAGIDRLVVSVARVNSELNKSYKPLQVKLGAFQTSSSCQLVLPSPTSKPWPANCNDVNDAAIRGAIGGGAVGFMLLNGKRLGNLSAMEAIPNQAIIGFQGSQSTELGPKMAGEIIWNAGSRDGVDGKVQKVCRTKSLTDCFIGRFGWVGDRVSLEDQVANAAFVEMNMTTSEGYKKLYANDKVMFPIRYAHPNCGPANKTCVESTGNADLSEVDVNRMAEYARWLGNPTRSDFQVAMPEVVAGEKIFRQTKCDTCHVIKKIAIVPDDTVLSKANRDRLATRIASRSEGPFLSYIGTDLLMHDMGYLSQVGNSIVSIRAPDGTVLPAYLNFMQKIRTPALKGLRFNRFVTDSHKNTKTVGDPACDFLLHDGRACDAIEAAFLHDGPAVKKLDVIGALNRLTPKEISDLRAFLYSL